MLKKNQNFFDEEEIFRKLTKKLGYRPVSEEQYERLIIPLKAMGVKILRGDEEIEETKIHLKQYQDALEIYYKERRAEYV